MKLQTIFGIFAVVMMTWIGPERQKVNVMRVILDA